MRSFTHYNSYASRAAFTLVELLVVVSIIVLLLGILIPATTLVLGGARESSNQALLRTLSDGAYSFNADLRYYPPLLAPDPDIATSMHAPDHSDSSRTVQVRGNELADIRWHSVTTPTVYLLGLGNLAPKPGDVVNAPDWLIDENHPNYGDRHDGADGLGIRAPGPDRSWGGAVTRANHRPSFSGPVYGPYVDPKIGESQVRPARIEDFPYRTRLSPPLAEEDIEDMQLLVIIDRYDTPIRYYKNWPERDRSASAAGADQRVPTLIDAPMELIAQGSLREYADAEDLPSSLPDSDLINRPCAFLSAGSDALWGERAREELVNTELLVAEDIRTLSEDDAVRVLDSVRDNQRSTPE